MQEIKVVCECGFIFENDIDSLLEQSDNTYLCPSCKKEYRVKISRGSGTINILMLYKPDIATIPVRATIVVSE